MLKCLVFYTNHRYYIDSPKYKAKLYYNCHINLTLTNITKQRPINLENEVKVR